MDGATLIALVAMVTSLAGAIVKYIDRRKQLTKDRFEVAKKQLNADVERESIVVRGAEGALLLMEKTLKTANDECEKRINDMEEENEALKCEVTELRQELLNLKQEMKELTRRVDKNE